MSRLATTTRRLLAALAAVSILLLAACGSDDGGEELTGTDETPSDETVSDEDSGDGGDAGEESDEGSGDEGDEASGTTCDLLTDDEVTEAFGIEPTGAEGDEAGLPNCEWTIPLPEDDPQAPLAEEALFQLVLMSESDYESRTGAGGDLYEEIDGPGDETMWGFVGSAETTTLVQYYVLDGDDALFLQSSGSFWADEADARSSYTTLAELVVERW